MSEIVCRRAGCTTLLSDKDAEQGYEHCSPECCEACEDLDEPDYVDKQAHHTRETEKRGKKRRHA